LNALHIVDCGITINAAPVPEARMNIWEKEKKRMMRDWRGDFRLKE